MAKIYGNYNQGQAQVPPAAAGPQQESKRKTLSNVFDLSLQPVVTVNDQLVVGKAQRGWTFRSGMVMVDTSLGTSTIAIGNAGTANKYKTAGTATALNTPTSFGAVQAGAFDPLTADEEILVTIAAASLPAAGKIYVDMDFLVPS